MKFTRSLSSLFFLVPLLAQVHATPLTFKGGFAGSTGNDSSEAVSASKAAATAAASATSAASSAQASASSNDPQSSLTLDPKVIATGFENNGQDVPAAGQVPSLTSSNNFINFCLTVPNLPITNGQQIVNGSCNPAPMGIIAATTNMPSSKFVFPTNGAVIQEKQPFTIQMAISKLDTGFFVNANENYFSAPQQIGSDGNVQGHSHVVVDFLSSLTDTKPTSPTTFAFFKGLNDPASNGVLTADVTDGLPAGAYRLASINTAANHQPVLVAIAQHGSLDDMVYFTVVANGTSTNSTSNPFSSSAAAASTSAASSAGGKASAASSAAAAATSAASKSGQSGQNQKGGNNNGNQNNNNNNKGGNNNNGNQNNNKGGNNSSNKGGNSAQARPPFGGFPFKVKRDLKSRM